jgi:DNA polymerase alpha subunit A
MKSKGGNARSGDVIPYVFCLAEGEDTARTLQADKAKHPDEVRRAGTELKIGTSEFVFELYIGLMVDFRL